MEDEGDEVKVGKESGGEERLRKAALGAGGEGVTDAGTTAFTRREQRATGAIREGIRIKGITSADGVATAGDGKAAGLDETATKVPAQARCGNALSPIFSAVGIVGDGIGGIGFVLEAVCLGLSVVLEGIFGARVVERLVRGVVIEGVVFVVTTALTTDQAKRKGGEEEEKKAHPAKQGGGASLMSLAAS